MMGAAVVLLVALLLVVVFAIATFKNMIYVVPPNQAMILSGRRRSLGDRTVGYRVVCGGRALRVPLLEQVDFIDLRNLNIDVEVRGAFSKGGIPLNVKAVANVKIPGEEPAIHNAVERFLGRTRNEIMYIAKETLEGNLRGVLAQLTPEQVNEDKNRFTQILTEEAEHDLDKLGIKLDQLKLQNVTDDVGYLNSIGRIRGAALKQKAICAEKHAHADAAVKEATNWMRSELARYDADIAIAKRDMAKRIVDARTKRDAMIASAEGQVRAEIATVAAEIKRQQARAVQVQRRLEADVVQPADAARLKAEEEAAGRAAQIVERGKAEAAALHELVAAYRKGGAAAKEVLVLQNMLPLMPYISGAGFPLRIGKLSMLAQRGDDTARKVIDANEQIKAATGVDLASLAQKVVGATK